MKINKTNLLAGTAMTPVEARMGRFMRAPDGHGDPAPVDNPAGNPEPAGEPNPIQDNDGQEGLIKSFWKEPEKKEVDTDPDPTPDPGTALGKELATRIGEANFGEAFTREIGEQLAEGNMEGANKQINDMLRQTLQQSVAMAAQVTEAYSKQLEQKLDGLIQSRLGGEKDQSALESNFDGMKDPAMAPVIQGVYAQAVKHTSTRDEALAMTRDMLKAMGKRGAKDMGLDIPPSNPDDNISSGGAAKLVDELLGRDS